MQFVYIWVDWKGNAYDCRILQNTLLDPNSGFSMPPLSMLLVYLSKLLLDNWSNIPNFVCVNLRNRLINIEIHWLTCKYYVVDAGYTNMSEFMALFRGVWQTQHEQAVKGLFNRWHVSLRNIIKWMFGVLKKHFSILKGPMQNYFIAT